MTRVQITAESSGGIEEPPGARLRADARRNRAQIIDGAKELFVAEGLDVPMEAIARRAGVGVGTLYRRFPDRAALIRAVADDNLRAVLADTRAAAAEEATAWDALCRLVRTSAQLRLSVRMALLSRRTSGAICYDPSTLRVRRELIGTLDRLVRQAQSERSLRSDVALGDVIALVAVLMSPSLAAAGPDTAVLADRALAVVLDGLRASDDDDSSGRTRLPGRPVSMRDLDRAPLGTTRRTTP